MKDININPNLLQYQEDLSSGVLDDYMGKYVAYDNGQIIKIDGEVVVEDYLKHLLKKVRSQGYQGVMYQRVGEENIAVIPSIIAKPNSKFDLNIKQYLEDFYSGSLDEHMGKFIGYDSGVLIKIDGDVVAEDNLENLLKKTHSEGYEGIFYHQVGDQKIVRQRRPRYRIGQKPRRKS